MKTYFFGLILLAGLVYTVFVPDQSDSVQILIGYSLAFLGYLGLCFMDKRKWPFGRLFLFGLIARILLIPFFPNLSDDIYRFYWDAHLCQNGLSPYAYLPSEVLEKVGEHNVFERLNSQNYYSVYPPLNQLLFFIAYNIGEGLEGFSCVLKIEFIILESIGLFYLGKLTKLFDGSKDRWFLYSLNPLIIIEGVGNVHIEVVMTSFLIVALFYLLRQKKLWMGILFFAGAIGVKIVPLLITPYILLREKKINQIKILGYLLVFMFFLFGPILFFLDLDTFSQSLDLYFRKFEFNASFYYLFRYLGYTFLGYNLIAYMGPILSLLVLFSVFYFAFQAKNQKDKIWLAYLLMGWSLYLFFSTIIHPWYIIPLVLFASITNWRFPVLWSYLIVLSYMSYGTEPFYESLLLVGIEYLVLFCVIIWEGRVSLIPR